MPGIINALLMGRAKTKKPANHLTCGLFCFVIKTAVREELEHTPIYHCKLVSYVNINQLKYTNNSLLFGYHKSSIQNITALYTLNGVYFWEVAAIRPPLDLYERTRTIVLPLTRLAELYVAIASSRVTTLPVFVFKRPSRNLCTISFN